MKHILTDIKKVLPLFFTLLFVASLASAVSYSGPSGTYPANNTAKPVYTGTDDGEKPGGLSVYAFIANQDANLGGATTFLAPMFGSSITDTLLFGGYDTELGGTRIVDIVASGSIQSSGSLFSQEVATSGTREPLCATTDGEVVLCGNTNPPGAICGNNIPESGEQCDDGNIINGDGCSSMCQIENPPIAADNIGVYSHSVQAGTGDENVSCSVSLTQPATQDERVFISYRYTDSNVPYNTQTGFCQLDIPAGASYIDNFPGSQISYGGSVYIESYCYDLSSTLPRSGSMYAPAC